ncbi:collagen alpha-1(XIV) chain-like isoform X1, partial [Tachysurus ichikawai]
MVNNLYLYDITHNSMRVRWVPAEGASGYMILYAPLSDQGSSDEKEVKISESVTEIELDGLTPATEYTVTVYAMYGDEASDPQTGQETTLSLSPARDLRITDVTHNSAKLSWVAASRKVKGYRIMYVKTDGDQTNEVEVGRVTTKLLNDLTSLTEYTVAIYAIYDEGQADPLTESFTTRSVPVPVSVRSSDVTTDSFRVSWQHAGSDISLYRLTWKPVKGGDTREIMVPANQNSVVLQPLMSDTEYRVSVTAVYADGDGPASTRSARTLPLLAPKNLKVSEEWFNRFRIAWDTPPSPTMGYRVIYQPISVPGRALETFVGDDVNTMLILNLLSGTEYSVKVIATYTTGSSDALTGKAKTLYLGVTNLNTYQVRVNSMCAQWQAHSHATRYRVTIESLL